MDRSISLTDHLEKVADPRTGKITYPLVNILFMTICAVIAGADDFVAIAHFANTKKDWFAKFLDMSSGIPSHNRFNSIFKHIKPDEFERCLLSWTTELHEVTAGQVIAMDGETLRRSYDRNDGKAAIHMVSAWATENHISLGQAVVAAKSNEVSLIPELPAMIEISGALVTIDAMGCQTEIAKRLHVGLARSQIRHGRLFKIGLRFVFKINDVRVNYQPLHLDTKAFLHLMEDIFE